MNFKLVDTVELDYDFCFYNMKNKIYNLRHGQYMIFENSAKEGIGQLWAIHNSIILFECCDGGLEERFTLKSHSSLNDFSPMYKQIQKLFDYLQAEYSR